MRSGQGAGWTVLLILIQTARAEPPIVNKCCPLGDRWEEGGGGCVRAEDGDGVLEVGGAGGDQPMWEASMLERLEGPGRDYGAGSAGGLDNATRKEAGPGTERRVVYRLGVSMPTCSSPDSRLVRRIIHKEVGSNARTGLPAIVLTPEGSLIWEDDLRFRNTYYHNDFCIDLVNETAFIALLCPPRCDESQPCIRKCCSADSLLTVKDDLSDCVINPDVWTPFLYNATWDPLNGTAERSPNFIFGYPKCSSGSYTFWPTQDDSDRLFAFTNGSLATVTHGNVLFYPTDMYCVDGTLKLDGSGTSETGYYHTGLEVDQVAIICYNEEDPDAYFNYLRYNILAFSGLASSIFLFLTALVYLINWEYQNIHGWLQFAYVGSSLLSFAFLAIVQLFTDEIHAYSDKLCESMGAVIHFSFLSAFFWLTSMNFDLWWTFSGWGPLRPSSRTGDKRRFVFFALFSWGFSGIIAGIGLVLDYMYKDQPDAGVIRPRFGERKCYFYGYNEQLPYFYGPVGLLLIVDLLFFTHTIYSLQKLQKDTKFATQQSSRQDKKRFVLFVRIFVVMGILWCFEVISWVIEVYVFDKLWQKVFLFFDVINALQGLWIFVIFTCKPNTCRQLEGKFKKLSAFLERHRDQEPGASGSSSFCGCLKAGCSAASLPFVHLFRRIFSLCGRTNRSLEARRNMTLTSNTFDKSRKLSESSNITNFSTTDPASYEMHVKGLTSPNPAI